MMKYGLIAIVCLFSMCKSNTKEEDQFNGRFSGTNNSIAASAKLSVVEGRLKGTILMAGNGARVNGVIDGNNTRGTLYDPVINKQYEYTGYLENDELHIIFKVPEARNRKVELVMQRERMETTRPKSGKRSGEKNTALLGTWRNTEVLSSGSGDNHQSFSTNYFMVFHEDGTVSSWTGKSAGGGNYRESDEAKAAKGEWYTDGKTLHLVDPASGQDAAVQYSVDESRLLLFNEGSEKKIFERIR